MAGHNRQIARDHPRWPEARHCYSPEMEYKRALGHRIYPRREFLALLARHRGPHDLPHDLGGGGGDAGRDGAPGAGGLATLCEGDEVRGDLLLLGVHGGDCGG